MTNYIPLGIKSKYSNFGMIDFYELYEFLVKNNIKTFALADDYTMQGIADMYSVKKTLTAPWQNDKEKSSIKEIKPIAGCKLSICDGEVIGDKTHKPSYQITLYAKDSIGYHNLVKLSSIASTEAFYFKPRINHKLLEEYKDGLICVSGNIASEISKNILNNDIGKAKEIAKYYKNLFKDDFYIELQDYGLKENKELNPVLIKIADELNIKTIISNDTYYLNKDDADFHDTLICAKTYSKKAEKDRFRFASNEFYLKTESELRKNFSWMKEDYFNACIKNTKELAKNCNFDFENEINQNLIPKYPLPEGKTSQTYLEKLVEQGLKKRYKEKLSKEIQERVNYELETINKMQIADYLLFAWDIISFAKAHNIPYGTGRGTIGCSIVAYALNITEIDPIQYNLPFERYINTERKYIPEIDIDFSIIRRLEVADYIKEKWGENNVIEIKTNGCYEAKGAFGAVLKIFEKDNEKARKIKANIDSYDSLKNQIENNPKLKKLYDKEYKYIFDSAIKIEKAICQTGVHAVGRIITPKKAMDIIPVELSKEGSIISSYNSFTLNLIGFKKFNLLGLKDLDIQAKTIELIKKNHNIEIDINSIPLNDNKTYEMISQGKTDKVFLLESDGMKKYIKKLKPNKIEELIAVISLYRPCPIEQGILDKYIKNKYKKQNEYNNSDIENILKETYGVIIYQEQVIQILQIFLNCSLAHADIIRKELNKRPHSEIEKDKFIKNGKNKGIKEAQNFYEQIRKSFYAFNKSHAASYSIMAYRSAYLKCHYKKEYSKALKKY